MTLAALMNASPPAPCGPNGFSQVGGFRLYGEQPTQYVDPNAPVPVDPNAAPVPAPNLDPAAAGVDPGWLAMVGSGGKRVYILPSQGLVVARLDRARSWNDAAFLRAISV